MLARGDLGFSTLILAVAGLVFTVIWIVLRRKWRFAAARREEIKRLLVLAAEESARAEFEATVQYGTAAVNVEYVSQHHQAQQPLLNQCAVCFSQTSKLCSQCKAVRYCSGKCQIIHWRQGHKEECRPYTLYEKSNEGNLPSQNKFNQEDEVRYGDSYKLDQRQYARKVELLPKKYTDADNAHVLHTKDYVEGEGLAEDMESNSSATSNLFDGSTESTTSSSESSLDASVLNESDVLDGLQSVAGVPFKSETISANFGQKRPSLAENSCYPDKSSIQSGQDKLVCSDEDCHCVSCSSSGQSIDDSGHSLSGPSTASGFWEGTINSRRSKNDADDDCTESSSSEFGGDVMVGPGSAQGFPTNLAKNNGPAVAHRGLDTKTLVSDSVATTSGSERHVSEAALSVKLSKDNLKSRKATALSSETSTSMHVDASGDSWVMKSREMKSSSNSNCSQPDGSNEDHLDSKNISSSPSLYSERSNIEGNNTISTSHASRFQKVGTILHKDSDGGFTSGSSRDTDRTAKLSKVDDGDKVTNCSSQLPTESANARNGLKSTMLKVVDQFKPSKFSRHYPMGMGSEAVGKGTLKGMFPYDLFVKLYNWNKVEMQPCGLINCGNSCYANAVLQCLVFTPPITAYLLQGLHSSTCEIKDRCFTCEFESLIQKAKACNSPLSPIKILSHIKHFGSHLGDGKEEDAHEFLRYVVDTMQSSCLKEATSKSSVSLDEETTLVGLTFGGYLRSKIKCMTCGGKSERHERIMDLTVGIDGNICTLEEALRKFTGTEILDGENKYKCSRCKSYEKAKKRLTIIEAPNVLTIALKRFQSGKFGKLSKSIQFPEILNMAPFMSSTSDMSPIYRLYGVVVHLDIMSASFSGHYVCYVKNIQNKWFMIDDSSVNPIELESVLTKEAYMLLYARCSPRAPKLLRNLTVPHDPRKAKNPSLKPRSHSTGPSDSRRPDYMTYQTSEVLYQDHQSFQHGSSILEDDSSSENSSSIFSEACSCSTESSTKDSMSTDDYFDQIFGDSGHNWNNSWWNSSDSDTSSSSSPSPLYSKNIPHTGSDHNATKYNKTNHYSVDPAESAEDGHIWSKQPSKLIAKGKGSPILCSDKSKQCKKVDSNSRCSSCRESSSDKLGKVNPFNSVNFGISLRRSSRGRLN